jgi:putative tryptophan/tyrosine transport system substrate-binding protein
MRRSAFGLLVTLALCLCTAPFLSDAQSPGKVPRIGFLGHSSPAVASPLLEAFRQGLHEHGWMEGQNLVIEYRWAEGNFALLPQLAAELVRLKVDVIVTSGGTPAALAAKQATVTIPIVMAVSVDPVEMGLVAHLAHPGGNLTGLTLFVEGFSGKRLELLKETVPEATRVAVLANPANPGNATQWRETQVATQALRLQLYRLEVHDPTELDTAFTVMLSERADALIVLDDPLFVTQRARLVALAATSRLPAIYGFREHAEAGGLMAYGANFPALFRRAATYVHKILKGATPADLPVEQPTKFELVINLKTAKDLGLTISPTLLFQADEVIR